MDTLFRSNGRVRFVARNSILHYDKVMRVAILHDYLNQFGGAERVLQVMLEMYPNADLYTLLYDPERTFGIFERNIKSFVI